MPKWPRSLLTRWPGLPQRLTLDDDQELVLVSERTSVSRLAEDLAALANGRGGGALIIGGMRSQPAPLSDVGACWDRALQAALSCKPPLVMPLPERIAVDGGTCLWVAVPRGLPQVYAMEGRYLVRRDGRNVPLSPQEVRALLVQRGQLPFDSLPAPGAGLEDLDWGRVQAYAQKLNLGPETDLRGLLERRGCLTSDGQRPTFAGILLFGRDPERFVRSSEIIAVRYAGNRMGDRFVREDIRGSLPDQILRAEAFALANMRKRTELVGLERHEVLAYPPEAVREAIVNAVAHRDYAVSGEGIRLIMFADRLEVYSPGRLPGHVTLQNILEERFSRNEIIVQVLSDLGYIERLGYGIDRMVAQLREHGLPDPRFEETANGFRVTLYTAGGGDLDEPQPSRGTWRWPGLNRRQVQAMEYVLDHGEITNRAYQQLCPEVSAETLRRDLNDLVRRGLLLRIGRKRGTYYVAR